MKIPSIIKGKKKERSYMNVNDLLGGKGVYGVAGAANLKAHTPVSGKEVVKRTKQNKERRP